MPDQRPHVHVLGVRSGVDVRGRVHGRMKIVPTQAVYVATKNAVRTLLEGLRQESTDGVLRTTSVLPGYVRTELANSIADAAAPEISSRGRV
jgi:NADP-dependent 3-hydroxy acid dehydrogenase YdfG